MGNLFTSKKPVVYHNRLASEKEDSVNDYNSLDSEEEDSRDDHSSKASEEEESVNDYNSLDSEEEDSRDYHNRMASEEEDSVDDHNSKVNEEEDSVDDHNSKVNEEEDSVDDHNSKVNEEEDSVDDHSSNASEEEDSRDDDSSLFSEEDNSLDDHHSMQNTDCILNFFKGTHEVQECINGQCEIDLKTHLINCKKNPGHEKFVPVNQLKVEHLPNNYHDNDVYNLIKALADLTVRIAVTLTSLKRPKFVYSTKDPYPCYNTRGQNSLRTGTGRVDNLTCYTESMDNYRTCPCPECDHSDTPSKVWWKVVVLTSSYVVFDESEARQTACRLWFDDDESPVVNIYGWKATASKCQRNVCMLHCVTHDIGVADKLKEMVGRFDGLLQTVRNKYKSRIDVERLTFIVSHPHGCSKQVSVGYWVHKQDVYGWSRCTYTTSTCPGSSGAAVYMLGSLWSCHPHSGANSNPNFGGLGYSGVYLDLDMDLSTVVNRTFF